MRGHRRHARPLHLPAFDEATASRLEAIFREAQIDSVVDVHNPIDLTPMTGDAAYEAVVRAVLEADGVDVGIVGVRAADGRAQHAAGRSGSRATT